MVDGQSFAARVDDLVLYPCFINGKSRFASYIVPALRVGLNSQIASTFPSLKFELKSIVG